MAISPVPTLRLPPLRQLALPLPPPPVRVMDADSGPPLPPRRLWADLSPPERERVRRDILAVVLEVAHERADAEP